jgi:alpha-glycerophosphate oxidase/glycerol-3-phosphate dehydrogenase
MSSTLRNTNLDKLDDGDFDVLIVGGGINGAVSAASLSAQGARVALIDAGDFAGMTSSQSSNLAWGGIKYLETWEFPLVWSLCKSRNHLQESYPSTVKEIRFLTTIERGFRFPAFFVFLGSLLYWAMGRFATRPPFFFSRRKLAAREPVIRADDASGGIEYSDCYLHDNDARFVFKFVRAALDDGAIAANYVAATSATRTADGWEVEAEDTLDGKKLSIRSKALVNACGPRVDEFNELAGIETNHKHVFSKGVHLMVDGISEAKRILAFFANDGRLFFVIPMGPKTCIGTTDTPSPSWESEVTDADRDFILQNANDMLNLEKPLTRDSVIAERCGVRPLAVEDDDGEEDWIALSRKHAIEADRDKQHVSIFGGKITDCLNVGDEVAEYVEDLGIELPYRGHKWYGEPDPSVKREFKHQARLLGLDDMTDPRSSELLSKRLWRRYGSSAFELLELIREDPKNAEVMIDNTEYLRCEIARTGRREMITKLEDFLRRRSKISLVVRHEDYAFSDSLREACEVLFGDEADAKLAEYLESVEQEHGAA